MPGKGIGLGNIYGHIFLQVKFMQLFLGNKSYPPYIRGLDADQHRFVKFSFVTGESLEKIFDRGIDEFDTRRPLQQFVGQVYQAAYDDGWGDISHDERDGDKNDKS